MGFPFSAPYDTQYLFEQFQPHQSFQVPGPVGTSDGTTASIATHKCIGKLPANTNIKVTGITARLSAGGTRAGTGAAVPVFAVYAASNFTGTGITGTCGTYDCGTDGAADGSLITFTLGAGVSVDAGSVLFVGESVGEDAFASDMVMEDIIVEYKETWL